MTVYDYCHVGHARVMVVFDVIARHLRASGYELTYVRNITDIDDKIIRRADENGEDIRVLTDRFIAAMHEDAAALGVLPPDLEPRATESMDQILAMIEALIDRGHAYVAGNGDVYYDVSSFPGYGRLASENLEDLRSGARVAVDETKDDPLDFALWKAAKPGEPAWESPWGDGRPGWHIECSAMSTCHLGDHFDIHGGGLDLKFPHHTNEIAQSEAATGCQFVNYWIHNGFVQVDEEKMSKSLGNFFTVRQVLEVYPAEELRLFILTSHYRSPLNYTEDNLDKARSALGRLYTALRGAPGGGETLADEDERFQTSMDDDFNTPEALAVLFDLAREINRRREAGEPAGLLGGVLRQVAQPLGLLQTDPDTFLRAGNAEEISAAEVEKLLGERRAARANRDFARADSIRDELTARGIVLEDTSEGTLWRRG